MTFPVPKLALSVRQPWAWAIIHAGKDIENREWKCTNPGLRQRGRVAIHASAGMTRDDYQEGFAQMRGLGIRCPAPADLIRGAVIGSVEIVDLTLHSDSPWFFGPFGFVLRNPEQWSPRACSGALGFFAWEPRAWGVVASPAKWMTAAREIAT